MNTSFAHAGTVPGVLLAAALGLLSGCSEVATNVEAATNAPRAYSTASTRSVRSGTTVLVALASDLSSRTANVGDAWYGTVTENVMNQDENVIPPGSPVDGEVVAVLPAQEGSRAMITLAIYAIRVDGHDESIAASAEPVIAGSIRARNLGAFAGGAEAGGGAGVPDGDQVVLSDGTVVSFTVSQTVAMR